MKHEKLFRQDHPETIGEKDRAFDMANYISWLEEKYNKLLNENESASEVMHNDARNPDAVLVCENPLAKPQIPENVDKHARYLYQEGYMIMSLQHIIRNTNMTLKEAKEYARKNYKS